VSGRTEQTGFHVLLSCGREGGHGVPEDIAVGFGTGYIEKRRRRWPEREKRDLQAIEDFESGFARDVLG
jgi:hypothetical protein